MAQTPKIPPRTNAGGLMTASVLQGSFQSDIAALSYRAQPIQMYGGGGRRAWQLPPSLMLARSGGEPMAVEVRQKMEGLFRTDFSSVRIHSSPQAQAMGALALTMGDTLHFAPGRYNPKTPQGMQILGHELAHVVQQRAGRVKAQGSGMVVLHDPALEAEADRFGRRAVAATSASQPNRAIPRQSGHHDQAPAASSLAKKAAAVQPMMLFVDKSQSNSKDLFNALTIFNVMKKETNRVSQTLDQLKGFSAFDADKTLTLFGHANQSSFGGYSACDLVKELNDKGVKNPQFKYFELLGCGASEQFISTKTFAEKFRDELEKVLPNNHPFSVRALPTVVGQTELWTMYLEGRGNVFIYAGGKQFGAFSHECDRIRERETKADNRIEILKKQLASAATFTLMGASKERTAELEAEIQKNKDILGECESFWSNIYDRPRSVAGKYNFELFILTGKLRDLSDYMKLVPAPNKTEKIELRHASAPRRNRPTERDENLQKRSTFVEKRREQKQLQQNSLKKKINFAAFRPAKTSTAGPTKNESPPKVRPSSPLSKQGN